MKRYEFVEIIVRIGKIKYLDKEKCKTYSDAVRKLIEEGIIPNQKNNMKL